MTSKLLTGNVIRGLEKIKLADGVASHFRLVFDRNLEDEYNLSSLDTVLKSDGRAYGETAKNRLRKVFCAFIDGCSQMTISEVNKKYRRQDDAGDVVYDTEASETFPNIHYSIKESGFGHFVRLHGHFNKEGYFIVVRVDWGHNYHSAHKPVAH